MIKIEAILPNSVELSVFEEQLMTAGAVSVAVAEIRIFNKDGIKTETYRGIERIVNHTTHTKIEAVAPDGVLPALAGIFNKVEPIGEKSYAFVSTLQSAPAP